MIILFFILILDISATEKFIDKNTSNDRSNTSNKECTLKGNCDEIANRSSSGKCSVNVNYLCNSLWLGFIIHMNKSYMLYIFLYYVYEIICIK